MRFKFYNRLGLIFLGVAVFTAAVIAGGRRSVQSPGPRGHGGQYSVGARSRLPHLAIPA